MKNLEVMALESIHLFTVAMAMYNIYVASMSLKWIKDIAAENSVMNKRSIDMFKIHAPMVFRTSIVLSIIFISISLITSIQGQASVVVSPEYFLGIAKELLTFLILVRCAQGVLFLEKCYKKRVVIPLLNFRFNIPIYQNSKKEYF